MYYKGYQQVYSGDPAARPGRMESIYRELCGKHSFVKPVSVNEKDLGLVHTQRHIDSIKSLGVYSNALLAVGGAIKASQIAVEGEPAFGLIRPPGHHARPSRSWAFASSTIWPYPFRS
ncbi:MAG: hypothetical protein ACOC6H_00820 [Thermoproteota archaeon]